jgi:hypothetical protein
MKHLIKMPRVAETTDEVYLVSWSKSIGDRIEVGEPLMEVETDKATVQIPSPVTPVRIAVLWQLRIPTKVSGPVVDAVIQQTSVTLIFHMRLSCSFKNLKQ